MNPRPTHGWSFQGTARFEICRRIGEGGMGVVYEAIDKTKGERVALKTLKALTPHSLLQFKQEFRILSDIEHPNLLSLGELIAEGDDWFFSMELVDGQTFLEYLRPQMPAPKDESGATESSFGSAETMVPELMRTPSRPAAIGKFDETRLRSGFSQLVRGLMALHVAGKIHRDIKPSNVLVDRNGRVVILDFGLAVDHARAPQINALSGAQAEERTIAGTVDYMSPEQASSQLLGPESDWYAVGVMLYESLTGDVPFEGDVLQILSAKQKKRAPPPRTKVAGLPSDLELLCEQLLSFSPADRPTGPEILDRLGERSESSKREVRASSMSMARTFVGRRVELDRLRDAFDASQLGQGGTAFVWGESGVGKSSLVRRFIDEARAQKPELVVLTGRCYERESVPYKAVDGIIDALSRHLGRIPKADANALLPRHASLLTRVFPVLSRIEAFSQAQEPRNRVTDPQELRSRVFSALREFFGRLSERHPLVLIIDDLQWADSDSLALLAEVMRPPDSPSLLLIATARPTAALPTLADLQQYIPGRALDLQLDRLPAEEAFSLAEQLVNLLGQERGMDARAIAREAGGHPLFIDALVRHALQPGATRETPLHLEDAFWARIVDLDESTRRLLEIVAVAGGPLQQQVAAQAAGVGSDFGRRLGLLKVAHLVRTTGSRGTDRVETYHDRVRAAVAQHVEPATARAHHQRIAVALETEAMPDAELLVVHWREAGVAPKAAHYAALAAQKAEGALAFDRAAQLYRMCLELAAPEGDEAARMQIKLGDALANAGRGADAAAAYLAAASQTEAALTLDLRRRAAEQLLRAGHVEEGIASLREVLALVGIGLAESPKRALASLLMRRAHVRLRGLKYKERTGGQVSSDKLTRIDACWSAATGLSMIDTIRGADFQTRHLLLALDAGEPYRIARALSMEAALTATGGAPASERAAKLHDEAEALSARLGHPHAMALAKLISGVLAFQLGRWSDAEQRLALAEQMLRERCTGVAWEVSSASVFRLGALFYLGRFAELVSTVPALVQEAEARGDLYATTNLRLTHMNSAWLAIDDPTTARREAERAMRQWPATGYLAQHYYELFAQINIDLYLGEGENAWKRIGAHWPALESSLFLRVQVVRVEALHLRGRAAIAALRSSSAPRPLRNCIDDCVKRLRRENIVWGNAMASLLEAGAAAARDDRERALSLLDEAAPALQKLDMTMYAVSASRAAAILRGQATADWDGLMNKARILRPAAMARTLVPGID